MSGQSRTVPIVLIGGAWLGGWCWKRVTPLLRAAGHDVYTPTLTGLAQLPQLEGKTPYFSRKVGPGLHYKPTASRCVGRLSPSR